MKKILTASLWIISLWVCLIFSFLNYDSSKKDMVISLISFIVMVGLFLFKITYCLCKNKKDAKIEISNSCFILSLFFLLLFRNHINFGYGNTLGILGYNRQIGILSMIGMSRTAGFIGLCISYAVFCGAFLFLFGYSEVKKSDKFKKVIIISAAILSVIIEAVGINAYFAGQRLSGAFLLSVIVYVVLYFLLKIFSREKAKDCR